MPKGGGANQTPMTGIERGRIQVASGLTIVGLAIFVVTLPLSVVAYPGGSWANPDATGFQFFVNYWCDLLRIMALNGAPNPTSAVLARIAFGALAVSLSAHWWVAASLLTSPSLAQWGAASGTVSAVGVAFLALFPYHTQPLLHSVTTLSAGGFGLAAAVLIILGNLQLPRGHVSSWRHAWGASLVAAAVVNILVYVDIVVRGDRDSAILPIAQELGTVFLVLWMVTTLLDARRRSRQAATRSMLQVDPPKSDTLL